MGDTNMIVKIPYNANYDVTKHKLNIISLNDAQAECSCGWYFCATGQRTKERIIMIHNFQHKIVREVK